MTHPRRPLSTQVFGVTERRVFLRPGSLAAVLWTLVVSVFVASPAVASGGKLVLMPDPMILGALLVFFVILVPILNGMIFRPLFRVLDDRDQKITGATHDAEQLVAKASELMDEYRGKIRGAREDAEAARREQIESARAEQTSITGEAKAEAEDEISRAREEIGRSLAEARATIEAASRDVAAVAAERILGRALR